MNSAEWGLSIALDFFFGGVAAGTFIFSVIFRKFKKEESEATRIAAYLSPVCLLIAMIFLFIHLGKPLRIFWVMFQFNPASVIAWGSILQIFFLLMSTVYALMVFADSDDFKEPEDDDSKIKNLFFNISSKFRGKSQKYKWGTVGLIFAFFLGLYHGYLLMSFIARPLWNTGIVPVITVGSFVSSGLAAVILGIKIKFDNDNALAKIGEVRNVMTGILVLQGFLISLWVVSLLKGSISDQRAAVTLIYDYGLLFWCFAFFLGIVVPAATGIKDIFYKKKSGDFIYTAPVVTTVFILAGSLFLRHAMIMAGQ